MDCPPCAANEICIGTTLLTSGVVPTCLKKCTTSKDCPQGMICAWDINWSLLDPACVSETVPAPCGAPLAPPADHCDFFGAPPCHSANVLSVPFDYMKKNKICGFEQVDCPNGCVNADRDAGTIAHCR